MVLMLQVMLKLVLISLIKKIRTMLLLPIIIKIQQDMVQVIVGLVEVLVVVEPQGHLVHPE